MKPFFAGNWKMHQDTKSSLAFIDGLLKRTDILKRMDIGLFPPYPLLALFQQKLAGSGFCYGAQNMHWEEKGAFTGEVSALLLKDLGCTHVIIGHSERRQLFKETDEDLNKKVLMAQKTGIIPIFCVGETNAERERNETEKVVERQLELGLKTASATLLELAYEPVWAIGTGKVATPEQAASMHRFIRNWLNKRFPQNLIRILYGGSVKGDNISGLMVQPDICGALVGGASLTLESFEKIFDYKP